MALNAIENERELILEIVDGNEKAFSTLFLSYISTLKSFALRFTRSEHAAEEIIQEAFVRIWLNRDKLEHVENIKAYIYKYVSNECLSHIKKKARENKVIGLFNSSQTDSDNVTMDSVHLNEIHRIVMDAVEKLPLQRRKVYQLSRGEGKTIPEIAQILKLSPNTVKNTLVVALRQIREHLIEHEIILFLLVFAKILK